MKTIRLMALAGTLLVWMHCPIAADMDPKSVLEKTADVQKDMKTSGTEADREKPLPAAKKVFTQQDYDQQKLKWFKKTFETNYEKFGTHGTWDAKVHEFILASSDYLLAKKNDTKLAEKLIGDATGLKDAGCPDTLVIYIEGRILQKLGRAKDAEVFLKQSLGMFEKSPYPPIFTYRAASSLYHLQLHLYGTARIQPELVEKMTANIVRAASDPGFADGNQRYFMDNFSLCSDYVDPDALLNELQKENGADKWISLTVQGICHIKKGWKARGGGWASGVQQDAWKIFHDELELARKALTEAYDLHPEFSEAATKMISVSMAGGGDESPRAWFDRASAAQFDCMEAYASLLWALRPRWGGSHRAMERFGKECLDTKRFDTDVPMEYFQAIYDIASDGRGGGGDGINWAVFKDPNIYKNMQMLFEKMLAEPANAEKKNSIKTTYGIAAWAAQEYGDAKKIFNELGDQRDMAVFCRLNADPDTVLGQMVLYSGDDRGDLEKANALFDNGQSLESLPIYQRIYDKLPKDDASRSLLNERLEILKIRSAFNSPEWISISNGKDMAAWKSLYDGYWQVESDGTLIGVPTKDESFMCLVCKAILGQRFEFEGDAWSEGCAEIRFKSIMNDGANSNTLHINTLDNKITLDTITGRKEPGIDYSPTQKLDMTNHFRLLIWDSHITVVINGQLAFFQKPIIGNKYIGFSVGRCKCVKFSNLRIRQLKEKPEESTFLPANVKDTSPLQKVP